MLFRSIRVLIKYSSMMPTFIHQYFFNLPKRQFNVNSFFVPFLILFWKLPFKTFFVPFFVPKGFPLSHNVPFGVPKSVPLSHSVPHVPHSVPLRFSVSDP